MAELQRFVDELKERLPIESVVGQRVQLQRRGNRYWGLCPFHAEKTPSFTVLPGRGFYKCFGCDASGDAITFVRETEGLEFFEALRVLADQAGMELPESFSGKRGPAKDERDAVRECLLLARGWFQERLRDDDAEEARAYLQERGVSGESARAFGIGWAPRDRSALPGFLARRGVPEAAVRGAGLLADDDGGRRRARFWERVMFPVADAGDRTVGFGGRYLPGSFAEEKELGKYVNSPEGPLFPKRRLLYGLERLSSALRDLPEDPVLVCEGYLDVVLLHQAGLRTALAALGTALTEDHARRLRRFERPVVLLLDPDAAGRRAAARGGRLLVAEGVDVRVAALPEGADPADMVLAGRTDELRRRVAESRDILEWRLDTWSEKADLAVPAVVDQAARECAEWISTTPSPVVAEAWERRACSRLGLTHQALRRLRRADGASAPRGASSAAPSDPSEPKRTPEEVLRDNEREIVAALLHDPSAFLRHRRALEPLELSDSVAKRVLAWCLERRRQGMGFDLEQALRDFAGEEPERWLDTLRHQRPRDPALALGHALDAHRGNLEASWRQAAPDEDDLESLRRFQRPVHLSPRDAETDRSRP